MMLYEDKVQVERLVSTIAGPGTETITIVELIESGGILRAFAEDEDIQQLTVASTNIGMVRRYTKRFKETT